MVSASFSDHSQGPAGAALLARVDFFGGTAKDGQLQVRAELARNDAPGVRTVRAEELASGRAAEACIRVNENRG